MFGFRIRGCHPLRPVFPDRSSFQTPCRVVVPQPQGASSLVWAFPRSLATTCGISELIFIPPGTEMFHFPGCNARRPILFGRRRRALKPAGLLHSEILGSKCVCHSPKLIAAYHVLPSLAMPRHPPCALSRLIVLSNSIRKHHLGSIIVYIFFCNGPHFEGWDPSSSCSRASREGDIGRLFSALKFSKNKQNVCEKETACREVASR